MRAAGSCKTIPRFDGWRSLPMAGKAPPRRAGRDGLSGGKARAIFPIEMLGLIQPRAPAAVQPELFGKAAPACPLKP